MEETLTVKEKRDHFKLDWHRFNLKKRMMGKSVVTEVVYQNIPETREDVVAKVTCFSKEKYWMILMTAGGHFVTAVFNGSSVVCHKTFHRYTVRAKRGTAQVARDNQQGDKQPK